MSNLIPKDNICLIAHDDKWQKQEYIDMLFSSLKGQIKRDWFIQHAYFCLPLVMGNQHGFVMKSLYDITVNWNGGDSPNDVKVTHNNDAEHDELRALQSVRSHFGMGTITIQTTFALRTPDGINLMTVNPPNYYIDGIYHMTGVIESDNLRRDFTFNLRITRPNYDIKIKKGDILGCVIPYPRHFIDNFTLTNVIDILSEDDITRERECAKEHGLERAGADQQKRHRNGRRYFTGEDVYGNKFQDHQTSLD